MTVGNQVIWLNVRFYGDSRWPDIFSSSLRIDHTAIYDAHWHSSSLRLSIDAPLWS